MSDRDALVAACVAAPGDDTPRLVFADWLDDHNEPARAELIRVMCRRVRLGGGAAGAATRRAQKILGADPEWFMPGAACRVYAVRSFQPGLCASFTAPAPFVSRTAGGHLWWDRGFVTQATFTSQTLAVVSLPGLLAEHPIGRVVMGGYWMVQAHLSVIGVWVARSFRPPHPDLRRHVEVLSRPTRGELLAALPAFLRAESDAIAGSA